MEMIAFSFVFDLNPHSFGRHLRRFIGPRKRAAADRPGCNWQALARLRANTVLAVIVQRPAEKGREKTR
jgi:hypothetical protein